MEMIGWGPYNLACRTQSSQKESGMLDHNSRGRALRSRHLCVVHHSVGLGLMGNGAIGLLPSNNASKFGVIIRISVAKATTSVGIDPHPKPRVGGEQELQVSPQLLPELLGEQGKEGAEDDGSTSPDALDQLQEDVASLVVVVAFQAPFTGRHDGLVDAYEHQKGEGHDSGAESVSDALQSRYEINRDWGSGIFQKVESGLEGEALPIVMT